jgi:hypothetical protein
MTAWTLAKYVLALGGVALVLLGDDLGRPWVGFVGIGLILMAFLLRFPQRRATRQDADGGR